MKIFLRLSADSTRRGCHLPATDAAYAIADGACPLCAATPFRVHGGNQRPSEDDRAWEADGACVSCGGYLGVLRAEVSTIFGVREDRAVLEGRCRVY